MLRHDTIAGLHIAADQPQAGMAVSVDGDHRMRHDPVRVAFLHRPQTAATLGGRGEFHLRGILDRQQVPPGDRRAGQIAPSLDDLRGGYFRIGEEPARLQFATTVTTQPAQADRLARDHPFEDRSPPFIEAHIPE